MTLRAQGIPEPLGDIPVAVRLNDYGYLISEGTNIYMRPGPTRYIPQRWFCPEGNLQPDNVPFATVANRVYTVPFMTQMPVQKNVMAFEFLATYTTAPAAGKVASFAIYLEDDRGLPGARLKTSGVFPLDAVGEKIVNMASAFPFGVRTWLAINTSGALFRRFSGNGALGFTTATEIGPPYVGVFNDGIAVGTWPTTYPATFAGYCLANDTPLLLANLNEGIA